MSDEQDLILKRNNLIAYVLNNATNKLPMKLNDLTFLGKPKEANKVVLIAAKALRNDFGIIMEELPDQKSGKKFICYAEHETMSTEELDENQKRENTLLFLILSYIFMSGGKIYEDQLESFLNGLKISFNEEHSYFGPNLKKLITETFVKQVYLKRKKSDSEFDIGTKYTLEWGFRAQREFQKMKVLEVAAMLMGKNAKFFQTQFAAAEEELKEQEDDVEMI